jgi:hypothetical protein
MERRYRLEIVPVTGDNKADIKLRLAGNPMHMTPEEAKELAEELVMNAGTSEKLAIPQKPQEPQEEGYGNQ